MRTRNLDEAIEAVSRVYCPHVVEVVGRGRDLEAWLEVEQATFQPVVALSYDVEVKIDAGNFSRLFLMMHCARGAASTVQEGSTADWRQGQTMPFSAGFDTQLWFDRRFAQRAVRLDIEKLEAQCARWLGRPLDRPLRFALQPFSEDLERTWQRALAFLRSSEGGGLSLSPAAKAAYDEFLLTLLLHHHPHSFSAEMAEPVPTPIPGLIIRAERFMTDHAEEPITVSDVAEYLGVSLRTLQAGFRSWRNSTPSEFLRRARLQRVREELSKSPGESNVTGAALRYGFSHLGRFSAYYHSAFGEAPSDTLRRGRVSNSRKSAALEQGCVMEPDRAATT